jgi:hypothetical protein
MSFFENQLDEILRRDAFTKKIYLGTFARDELVPSPPYPSCFIINTDPRSRSGGHWLALYYK